MDNTSPRNMSLANTSETDLGRIGKNPPFTQEVPNRNSLLSMPACNSLIILLILLTNFYSNSTQPSEIWLVDSFLDSESNQ